MGKKKQLKSKMAKILKKKKIDPKEQELQELTEEQKKQIEIELEEINTLQNNGYFRLHLLNVLAKINENLNGIGKVLSKIGEVIEATTEEREKEEEEEEEEESEDEEEE